jgi:GntR family transcriptional regulator
VVKQLDVVISNSSPKPIYEQIADQIKNQIITGVLAPGDALPSMRLLAKDLHISVITTKRAYSDLERDGFVETVAGKGCFVAPKNREFLREEQLRKAEEALQAAVDIAKRGGITLAELDDMLALLYNAG